MTVANSPLLFPSRSGGPTHATIQIQPSDIWPSFSSLVFSVDVGYNFTKTTMVILAAVDMSTSTPRGAQVFTNKLGFALEGRCFNIARTVSSCDILWYQSYTSYRSQKKSGTTMTTNHHFYLTNQREPIAFSFRGSNRTYPEADLNFVLLEAFEQFEGKKHAFGPFDDLPEV